MKESFVFPKVLVIGINAWREDGTAHTLMDIFRCWDSQKLALIYTRADLPNTNVCSQFFQISESKILRSVIRPWIRVGEVVKSTPIKDVKEITDEHARYTRARQKSSAIFQLLREFVWKFGQWKTPELKKFVQSFNPDIIFAPIYPTVYMGWIQKYVINLTKKPTVCYLADDNYSYDSCHSVMSYIHRWWLRRQVGPLARGCREMFVIVEREKEDTDRQFGTDSVILTKSIDFEGKVYRQHALNKPLRFVYTGSMVIGRERTLALLADSINKINIESGKISSELFIYSQTEPSNEVLSRINRDASHFCGRISREEVQLVQQNADVVVFAEALDGKEANAAKLSFSTKITDYLSNGKCILAIGIKSIAPIDYFVRNDSAIVACSSMEIEQRVTEIIAHPEIIDEYGEKAFNCAFRNHEKGMMNNRFIKTMLRAVNPE